MAARFRFTLPVVAVALLLTTSTVQAAKGVKKKGEHTVHGKVVHVHHDKKSGHGTITVKVHHHKKKATPTSGAATTSTPTVTSPAGQPKHHHSHHTFHVSSSTRFESVHGKEHKSTTFAAVHKGEHVAIHAKGHQAEKVAIHHHKGKRSTKPTKTTRVKK